MKQQMLQELSSLPSIPEPSAEAYHEHLTFLLDKVNKKMASRQDIQLLIGQNPKNAMYENHRNHAVFMDNVFQLGVFSLLPEIVPWVYRTYTSHGFSFDYFPAHLRAWKEALEESWPAQTRDPLLRVYDWMLSHHGNFQTLSRETSFIDASVFAGQNESRERFLQALLQGERKRTLEIGLEQASNPQELKEFYQGTLRPAMYRIGELWEQGEITVSTEHLASALANMVVSSQYVRVMSDLEPWKGRILVTASTNEFHVLGAQTIANCLEAEGWEVDYLGADTPTADLVAYMRKQGHDIVAISVTMPFNLLKAKEIIDLIKKEFRHSRPRIMLGGLAFLNDPDIVFRIGGDGFAEDCARAIELAEQWRRERSR